MDLKCWLQWEKRFQIVEMLNLKSRSTEGSRSWSGFQTPVREQSDEATGWSVLVWRISFSLEISSLLAVCSMSFGVCMDSSMMSHRHTAQIHKVTFPPSCENSQRSQAKAGDYAAKPLFNLRLPDFSILKIHLMESQ